MQGNWHLTTKYEKIDKNDDPMATAKENHLNKDLKDVPLEKRKATHILAWRILWIV